MANVHEHTRTSNGIMPVAQVNLDLSLPKSNGIAKQAESLDFIQDGFVRVSVSQADLILRECLFEHQRRVDSDHVKCLTDMMSRGLWMDRDKLDFAKVDGKLILVNGYHRLTAQVMAKKKIEWTIVITECRTLQEVRSLYCRFDTNTRKRSNAQILNASDLSFALGTSKTMAEAVYKAVPLLRSRLSWRKSDMDVLANRIVDTRLSVARAYAGEARVLEELLDSGDKKIKHKMMNAGMMAVALTTMKYQPEKAKLFWGGTVKNDGLRVNDPRRVFVMDLLARNFKTGSMAQIIWPAVVCWNAFFNGRPLKTVRVFDDKSVTLAGIPKE